MIVNIPNQPIVFADPESENGACTDDGYCQPVFQHDRLCFQHRQTSCLPQLVCSPDFSDLGDELIVDGDFYSNPYGEGGWDIPGDDWIWDEDGRKLCINPVGGYGELTYNITEPVGCLAYRFTFTVSDLTEDVANNEVIVTLPDGSTVTITENGVYTYIVDPGPTIKWSPEPNFDGCIDDISLRCVSECWIVTTESESATNGGLEFNVPGICKPAGIAVSFTEVTGTLESGKYYQVWVDVLSMTGGSLEVFLGGVSIGTITEAGIYPLYGTSGGTDLSFTMSDDFAGCINSIKAYLLSQDLSLTLFTVFDLSLADLDAHLIYTRDLIEACIEITPEFLSTFPDSVNPRKDCWKLVLESPDDGELVTNGEMELAIGETLTDFYDLQNDDNLQIVGVQGQAIWSGGDGYLSQQLTGLAAGTEYYVAFDILCMGGTNSFDAFSIALGADAGNTGGTQVFTLTDFPEAPGRYIFKVTAGNDGDYISLHFTDDFDLTKLCITNLSVRLTACAKQTLESNCIKYHREEPDSSQKLVTACNEEGESMGFDWSTGFKLHGRVPSNIVGPSYASPEDNTYLFSDSRRHRTYAVNEKKQELRIFPVTEIQHDWIRAALKCDVVYWDVSYPLLNRIVCLDNEYVPEWERTTMPTTAGARVEIQKYDNVIFNTNCS